MVRRGTTASGWASGSGLGCSLHQLVLERILLPAPLADRLVHHGVPASRRRHDEGRRCDGHLGGTDGGQHLSHRGGAGGQIRGCTV